MGNQTREDLQQLARQLLSGMAISSASRKRHLLARALLAAGGGYSPATPADVPVLARVALIESPETIMVLAGFWPAWLAAQVARANCLACVRSDKCFYIFANFQTPNSKIFGSSGSCRLESGDA